MSCYHPMHAFQIGLTDNGKPKYQIESETTEWTHPKINGQIITDKIIKEYIEIPCGKCIGCRLDYSRKWATRCMLEASCYKNNAFVTLTYAPEFLPIRKNILEETGEYVNTPTLQDKDLTKFMKDLRRYFEYHYGENNIRFYACGEYGELYERPHYHIIIFNIEIKDLEPLFKNAMGQTIYTSKSLETIWGKGIVRVGEVTWESAAYVARYVMKKQKGPNSEEYYATVKGYAPEFVRMSRKPGIARQYYEDNKEKIYTNDELFIIKKGKALKVKPVAYFDKLYDVEQHEKMQSIKLNRKESAKLKLNNELSKTSLNKLAYMELKEKNKLEQLKKLHRNKSE